MEQSERFGPTRRGGPVFRWLGEPLAIDLANTVMVLRDGGEEVDLIATPTELRRWLSAERERLGPAAATAVDPDRVRELRDATRELLRAVAEESALPAAAIAVVNSASLAAPASPLLAEVGAARRRREGVAAAEGPAVLLGVLARAAIELLTGPEAEGLRICRAPSCGMLYTGARRWCCSACGNRARAARHYERRRQRAATSGRR
jgi:predicted RNA-binding Zn ribbon-like protein